MPRFMEYFVAFCMFIFLGVLLYNGSARPYSRTRFPRCIGDGSVHALFIYAIGHIVQCLHVVQIERPYEVRREYNLVGTGSDCRHKYDTDAVFFLLGVGCRASAECVGNVALQFAVGEQILSCLVTVGGESWNILQPPSLSCSQVKGAVFVATDTADLAPAWSWIIKMGLGTAGIVAYAAFVYFKNRNLRLIP